MATRCKGDHCPYGYGHTNEHREAARLGWRRRHEGEAKYLTTAFRGYEVHSHANGKVILRDTSDDSTFELSNNEARQVIQELRTEERNRYVQARLTDKATAARVRADNALTAKRAHEARRAIRDAERAERQRQREDAAYQRMADRENRDMLYSAIREVAPSGIRNYRKDANGKRILQEDVWANIPKSFRSKASATSAQTPDEVASVLSEYFPYLGIETDSDLAQALSNQKFRQNARKEKIRRQAA